MQIDLVIGIWQFIQLVRAHTRLRLCNQALVFVSSSVRLKPRKAQQDPSNYPEHKTNDQAHPNSQINHTTDLANQECHNN